MTTTTKLLHLKILLGLLVVQRRHHHHQISRRQKGLQDNYRQ
jgi:hypothetical protein